jgi:large subunit ribosomal protein L10
MPNDKNIKSVEKLTDKLSKAKSIYFTDYLGLNVSDITKLRKEFFVNNVEYMVVKNTLLKIAADNNKIALSDDLFAGSTAIAVSYDEPVAAAKVIKEFSDEYSLPAVKGILFDGQYLAGEDFIRIAELPSKEESITKFAMMIKSPMQNLATMLRSPMANFVNLLYNIKET